MGRQKVKWISRKKNIREYTELAHSSTGQPAAVITIYKKGDPSNKLVWNSSKTFLFYFFPFFFDRPYSAALGELNKGVT